jgi:D-alanyl-lipoteichoic acid acyltransferase DltB (MBOAT superfamily)
MLFNSYVFLFLFLPLTLAGFFLIGGRGHHRIAISWLVACSLFFYGWWNPAYLGLILASIFFNYAMGVALAGRESARRKLLLGLGVTVNLGLLAYFKYANFFVDSINLALGSDFHLETILLPLAISFFTFQQIAYLVDAYRGETREYNFLHYCLFVTFFPQLIAGPIVHHREMLPQFARNSIYRLRHRNLAVGLTIFTIGLFKKVVLADGVAVFANPVFAAAENGAALSMVEAWGGALAYTLQIYFDFSGYSDMAIGLGRLFGIRLPLNFHSPLKAVNLIELWHRWHMTLSRFLRDYLYFPLGGNRRGATRRYINLMVTMMLGGLWHGAGWTFLVWGTAQGLGLIVNHAWHALRRLFGWRAESSTRLGRGLSVLLTFIFFAVTLVVFRAETFSGSMEVISAMFGRNGLVLPAGLAPVFASTEPWLAALGITFGEHEPNALASWSSGFEFIAVLLAIIWFMPNTQQFMRDFEPAFDTYRGKLEALSPARPRFALTTKWAVMMGLLLTITIGSLTRVSEFLYFQF